MQAFRHAALIHPNAADVTDNAKKSKKQQDVH